MDRFERWLQFLTREVVDSQGIDDAEPAPMGVETEVEDAELHGLIEERRDTHDQHEVAAIEPNDLDA